MTKVAGVLAIISLGLLLASLIPRPDGSGESGAAQAADTNPLSEVEQGRALFLAKGCATCHRHDTLSKQVGTIAIGPNLSHYRPEPDFVRRWLRDPAAVRPGTQMPDLGLSDEEITALIAFLGAGEDTINTATAPESCPVTRPPDQPFEPPAATGSSPVSFEAHFWYGDESLWTQLPRDGVWQELPRTEQGYTQKIFFSRQGYDWVEEPLPALTVSGRRLDLSGLAFEELEATNGFHPDVGAFMLVGVDIPTAGCWEITGHYQGQELDFIVWVA